MENLISQLLQDFETGKMNRRQLIQSLALAAAATSVKASPAVAASGGFKTVDISHVSLQVKDYRVSRDFYADLMGMTVTLDNGRGRNESILTWGRGLDQYL